MRQKQRVRLAPLTATRRRLGAHQRITLARRPEIERRRAPLTIRAAPTDKTETVKASGAVAPRAIGDIRGEPSELYMGDHTLIANQPRQPPVAIAQLDGRTGASA